MEIEDLADSYVKTWTENEFPVECLRFVAEVGPSQSSLDFLEVEEADWREAISLAIETLERGRG